MSDRDILLAGEALGASLDLRNALRHVGGDPRVFMPPPADVDRLLSHGLIEEANQDAWRLSLRYRVTDLGKLALGLIGERG